MPIKTIEKVINDHNIKINQFHAVRGFKLKARLTIQLLPVFAPFIGSLAGKKMSLLSVMDSDIDLETAIPKALNSLAEKLDEEVFFKLILDLLSSTFIDNKVVDENLFNDVFIANYMFMYKLVYEVVMINNFFDFGGIGQLLKTQVIETPVPEVKS